MRPFIENKKCRGRFLHRAAAWSVSRSDLGEPLGLPGGGPKAGLGWGLNRLREAAERPDTAAQARNEAQRIAAHQSGRQSIRNAPAVPALEPET